MFRPLIRALLSVGLITTFASAEGEVEAVHEDVEAEAEKLGEKAGVNPEILKGGAYGSAGCGLGSIIFEPSNGFMQVFAATTNGSSGNQTFGISSGTSNCDGAPHTAESVRNFIVANRSALSVEVARGGGEAIRSLSALAQCQDGERLGRKLQQNFTGIFPSASVSDSEVSDRMVHIMARDSALSCSVFG